MEFLRTELGMQIKNILRPVKHKLFGKSGIYKAIELTKNAKVILDIGAAIGETAIPMAKAFPDALVFCYEPIQCRRLARRTRRYENILPYELAIWNKVGKIPMMVTQHEDSSSAVKILCEPFRMQLVSTVTLDMLDFKSIDLIKIDAEGAEKEILEGATETLKITKNLFIEINGGLVDMQRIIKTFEILERAGFEYVGNFGDFFFTKKT
jgi:FkbM family methyltransferase